MARALERVKDEPHPVTDMPEKLAVPRPVSWLVGAGLWATGTAALGLGFLGIFVPLLPTTPLLLLAAACYVRVSPRAYRWLLGNRLLGPLIHQWRAERTVPV